jgi:hypothetical protein
MSPFRQSTSAAHDEKDSERLDRVLREMPAETNTLWFEKVVFTDTSDPLVNEKVATTLLQLADLAVTEGEDCVVYWLVEGSIER